MKWIRNTQTFLLFFTNHSPLLILSMSSKYKSMRTLENLLDSLFELLPALRDIFSVPRSQQNDREKEILFEVSSEHMAHSENLNQIFNFFLK